MNGGGVKFYDPTKRGSGTHFSHAEVGAGGGRGEAKKGNFFR